MDSVNTAKNIRQATVHMVHQAKASHIGSCFSMADMLAVLYCDILKVDPKDPRKTDRDRFILSKGHATAILYAMLAEKGFFPKSMLEEYCVNGSPLIGHVSHAIPGVEISTGSLGHGLPIACGMALAGKADNMDYRVFTMLSDGEVDEGSNWEAILFAPHHHLDNLTVLVDYNKIQSLGRVSEVLDLEPMVPKWQSCGWAVKEIDGHNHKQIKEALASVPFEKGKPSVIIAHTTKGKGVGYMEDRLEWHYRSPDLEQLKKAVSELEG